jgi:hypothetical protein
MRLRGRVTRLERAARRSTSAVDALNWLAEEGWLEHFEALGRAGVFAREPDFPQALETYRAALRRAAAQTDPPFEPPADFLPQLKDQPGLRLLQWRGPSRFPEVQVSWEWLAEMLDRMAGRRPPLTEAEYADLAAWFSDNAGRLDRASRPAGLLDLGGGRTAVLANLRYRLPRGARVVGAGELAEDIRRLRSRYGVAG